MKTRHASPSCASVVAWCACTLASAAFGQSIVPVAASSADFYCQVPARIGLTSLAVSVAAAGDVDGDGTVDIIVGAPETVANSSGRAYVFSGADGSLLSTLGDVQPVVARDYGTSVAGLGDVDNDGYSEVAVGSPIDSIVYVYSGASLRVNTTPSVLYTITMQGSFKLGFAITGVGDVSGDTVPDLLVGDIGGVAFGQMDGQAFVFSGANGSSLLGSPLTPNTSNKRFGQSVGAAGDVDGDGQPDFVVGATDKAYVFSGASGSHALGDLLFEFSETVGFNPFAYSCGGVGDVNNDGRDDVAAGARNNHSGDQVFVYGLNGGASATRWLGFPDDDAANITDLGNVVFPAGDVNNDGYADVASGGYHKTIGGLAEVGRLYVVSGKSGRFIQFFDGASGVAGMFGWGGFSADINGDSILDYAVSAKVEGRVYVFLGPRFCIGDLNFDGVVNSTDLAYLYGAYGACASAPPASCSADLNGDGAVDGTDASILLGNWGACP